MDSGRRIFAGLIVVVLAIGGATVGAGAQTEDGAAWCQARVDLEASFGFGDESLIGPALEAFGGSAPAGIADDSAFVAELLDRKGEKAFSNKKFSAAISRIDEYAVANCGYPVVDVTAMDYEYAGVPESISAGTTAIYLTNGSPKEEHEIVVFRVKDGVTKAAPELFGLPEKKAQKVVQFVGGAEAAPGASAASITNLEPGRYVYGCFLPLGGKKKGAPHFTKGMVGEFEVTAG